MDGGQITLHGLGIVIVGANHNPSILNPDFLRYHGIVPEGRALDGAAPCLSTPSFSQVAYKDGLQIVSEPSKISFLEDGIGDKPPVCPEMAKKYLQVVPLVQYVAVGINPVVCLSAPGGLAPAALLKSGEWRQFNDASPNAVVQLEYALGPKKINLTVQASPPGSAKSDADGAVYFLGNFHRSIEAGANESHRVAASMVDEWENDLNDFRLLTEQISHKMEEER